MAQGKKLVRRIGVDRSQTVRRTVQLAFFASTHGLASNFVVGFATTSPVDNPRGPAGRPASRAGCPSLH